MPPAKKPASVRLTPNREMPEGAHMHFPGGKRCQAGCAVTIELATPEIKAEVEDMVNKGLVQSAPDDMPEFHDRAREGLTPMTQSAGELLAEQLAAEPAEGGPTTANEIAGL